MTPTPRPDEWSALEAICWAALERPVAERAAYLATACAGEPDLRRKAEELLAQIEADPEFLERPALTAAQIGGLGLRDSAHAAQLGPYRIVRPLGRGGMGEVLLAVREGDGFQHTVAIKVVHAGMDTADVLRRFARERAILAALNHPNIAHFIDAGSTPGGRPYFVLEFVDGVRIDRYCDERALGLRERLQLIRTICDAVQHAHGNLVIHRDLKPGNILVTRDGVPKLLDFGIGKLVAADADAADTRTDVSALTPEYASPEQIRGDAITTATDVHGLGLLLYELLAGRHPFGAGTRARSEVEQAIVAVEPERPSRVASDSARRRQLAGDLDTIILKALRKDPARRYVSPAALAEDLDRFLSGRPVQARPDTTTYRFAKFVRRNPWAVGAAVVSIAALATITAMSVRQSRELARERDSALEVRAFLLESFGARRADQTADQPVAARQLLDQQAATLDFAYADRPELQAEMLQVVAEGYERLGLYPDAELRARESLERRQAVAATSPAELAWGTEILGWIRYQRGNPAEADTLLRRSIALFRSAGAHGRRGLGRALNDLGVVAQHRGDLAAADSAFREALAIRTRYFPGERRGIGVTASNLAALHYRRSDFASAMRIGAQALEALRSAVGPDHSRSIIVQGNLAAFALALGDPEAAGQQYTDLLERQTRLQGRAHPVTTRVMSALSSVYLIQGRAADAVPLLLEALAAQEAALGPSHSQVAVTLRVLGDATLHVGDIERAAAYLDRAVRILRAELGPGHIEVAEARSLQGRVELARGNTAAAVSVLTQSVAMFDSLSGRDQRRTSVARTWLARALVADGKRTQAEAMLTEIHGHLVRDSSRAGVGLLQGVRLVLAQMALDEGRTAVADSLIAVVERDLPRDRSERVHRVAVEVLRRSRR